MFWTLYILLSVTLIFALSKLFKNIYLKLVFCNLLLALFLGIWFIQPGSDEIAPILSIFLLEISILESNGIYRLYRPFFTLFVISLIITTIYRYFRTKN
jgi:hypothetical protein